METAITRDGQRRNSWMCGDDYVEEGEEKKEGRREGGLDKGKYIN